MPEIAGKNVSTNDTAVLGAGVLYLIASFLPFYGASVSGGGYKGGTSTTAWHGIMILAILLVIAATAIVAVRVFGDLPDMPIGPRLAVLGASGIAAVITIIRVLTLDRGTVFTLHYGPRFGAWLLIIVSIVLTAFAFMAFRESGETMPSAGGGMSSPPPGA